MLDRHESRWELNDFKREINLVQYAREQGYEVVKHKSCRSSKCLRHPSGDKIIVARDRRDDHWIYFSVRDDRDKGTIIDFVQTRQKGADLAEVRRTLRQWLGRPEPTIQSPQDVVIPVERDRAVAAAAYLAADQVPNLRYLNERGLKRETLTDPQFAETWRRDPRHGNALFVHRDHEGISGFEKKNRSFSGFATGGEKTFWYSDVHGRVARFVVAESAIDALSHYQLRPQANTRYMSFAGEMSSRQVGLLTQAAAKLPQGGEVVLAVDNDPAGDQFVRRLTASLSGLPASVRRDSPNLPGQDWNDVLRAREHEFIRNLPALGFDPNHRRSRLSALGR